MNIKIACAFILLAVAPSVAFAQPQVRDANNETSCASSGMGMDPRCVGDVGPSNEMSAREDLQVEAVQGRHAQAVIPAPSRRHL
jgi:hypothetical protein